MTRGPPFTRNVIVPLASKSSPKIQDPLRVILREFQYGQYVRIFGCGGAAFYQRHVCCVALSGALGLLRAFG